MSAATVTALRDAKLETLPDDQFRELVDREIRKDHPGTPAADRARLNALSPKLREPAVIHRWIMVLETMKDSAETQLGAKRSELKKMHGRITEDEYLDRLRTYQGWKAGNVRFLNSVKARLLEARYQRMCIFGVMSPTRLIEERNLLSEANLQLVRAIEAHRQTVLAEYDPTEADEALWAAIQTTVKELL